MRLLVGLGNPGAAYARHRHNIGFMAIDAIAAHHRLSTFRSRARFAAEIAEGTIEGLPVLAIKPATYMNESGRAVGALLHFHKLTPADAIVFHDELDLAPGRLRVKFGGGAAGHNGLRSLEAHIGADFWRVRLGIGHPGDAALVSHFVLSDFSIADRDWLGPLIEGLAVEAPLLLRGEDNAFMSKVAQRLTPARPKAPRPKPPPDGTPDAER
jgi:PTH1 family peptidyl-tRNA hydrolase